MSESCYPGLPGADGLNLQKDNTIITYHSVIYKKGYFYADIDDR